MTNHQTTNDSYNPGLVVGIIGSALIIIAAVALITSQTEHDNKGIALDKDTLTVAEVRLASAKNALDGSGNFTNDQCNALSKLSKKFNSKSDFIDCSSPEYVYLSTPDTADKHILVLSDESYSAEFVTDEEVTRLLDYSFSKTTHAGFNKFGGRR